MRLEAENLFVERGSRAVITGLSFGVDAGEALLLTGPNGSGKTTLIRTVAGFIVPKSGRVTLKADSDDRVLAERCHYVGHLSGIKASLTVEQNLDFWSSYLDDGETRSVADRIDEALEAFGLSPLAGFPAGLLSAGQKRRLGLARLLVASRPVWLLDEPTVSLDATSAELLAKQIHTHLAGGGLVIAATHLPLGLERPSYLRLGSPAAVAADLPPEGAAP